MFFQTVPLVVQSVNTLVDIFEKSASKETVEVFGYVISKFYLQFAIDCLMLLLCPVPYMVLPRLTISQSAILRLSGRA